MVQSKATTVDEWLDDVVPERRVALERLRALCRDRLPDWWRRCAGACPAMVRRAAIRS